MRSHEAGALHADGYGGPPLYLPFPSDVNALLPQLWAGSVCRDPQGRVTVAGLDVASIAREHGTPAYVVDEGDFRARARSFRDDFAAPFETVCGGADIYYAGKAFLCTSVAKWVAEEGLSLDVCSGGELAVARRAHFPAERIGFHGNNKSVAEIRDALDYGVGRIVVDSFVEIERVAEIAADLGVVAPVMIRVTVGVEAHTHEFIATAHEDQKFGFSLANGAAAEAARRVVAAGDALALVGLHSHIGSQIFDPSGFEVAAHRVVALMADVLAQHPQLADTLTTLDLGGGLGIAYVTGDDPPAPDEMAKSLIEIVTSEAQRAGVPVPRIAVEPGRAIAGPGTLTLYEVGTIKDVELDGGLVRRYVSVDGGMSDNIRTALYDAEYTVVLASRTSEAPPALSRVVGKHCESGDIVVRDCYLPADLAPGDLLAVAATGAYCYAMSSNYNRLPRPAVVTVTDGTDRVMLRRETDDDLMQLENW